MLNNPFIGGTCGETQISNKYNFTNIFLCSQILECKLNHSVDKHFESLYGFVSS